MSELRERKKPAAEPVSASIDASHGSNLGGVIEPDDPKKLAATPRTRPAQPSRPPTRLAPLILNVIFGLAIVGLIVLILQAKLPKYPPRFGICTFDSAIYIDAHATAQCVVIGKDGTVEYTGTRDDTRDKYGDLDTLGKLGRWNLHIPGTSASTGLKIYTIPTGQSVIPGRFPFISFHTE
jgi:hypothetical protein